MDRPLDGTMLADCPDDDLIDRFVRGAATDSEQMHVRGHLPPCDACRRPFGGQRYKATMISPIPNDREEA